MKLPLYEFCNEEKFEDELSKRIEYVIDNFGDSPFLLTSNPLVDAGIYAISIKSNKKIQDISLGDAMNAFTHVSGKDTGGYDFARRNARAKAISKTLFNNPLNQPAYGSTRKKDPCYRSPSKAEPSPLQQRLYRAYMVEFLFNYGTKVTETNPFQCIICGSITNFDFNELETTFKALIRGKELSKKDDFGGGPTRSWIPLLGSVSSAQAFPGFAEPNIVCGKCLFASQFLPQITNIQNGNLVTYQSNNHRLAREFIKSNLDKFEQLDQTLANDKKIDIIGSDDNTYHILNLLKIIARIEEDLSHSSLIIWQFDNYGTDPEVSYTELPEDTLIFLHRVSKDMGLGQYLTGYVAVENKAKVRSYNTFLNCLISQRDYPAFYQKTEVDITKHTPQRLYDFYQIEILKWSPQAIETLHRIAKVCQRQFDDQEKDRLIRALKERNYSELRSLIIPKTLLMLQDEKVSTNDLLHLFEGQQQLSRRRNPWKLFRYYLHPSLKISPLNYEYDKRELNNFDKNRLKMLALIEFVALSAKQFKQQRSSFDHEKYLDHLSRYSYRDFEREYVRIGSQSSSLTWTKLKRIESTFYRNEILLYYRIFSISSRSKTHYEDRKLTINQLIENSGLHPITAETLIHYINKRIEEIGSSRVFSELLADIRNERYSSRKFFDMIRKRLEKYAIDTSFSEYHWFTYEKESSVEYTPKGSDRSSMKPSFSWRRLRTKLRLFISQYREVRKNPTLLEQVMEENK